MTTQNAPTSMYRTTEGLGIWEHRGKVAAVGVGTEVKACVDSGFGASLGGRHHWGFGWQAGVFLCRHTGQSGRFVGNGQPTDRRLRFWESIG